MLKRFSLNKKIWFVVGVFIFGCITISYLGISNLKELNESITEINQVHVTRMMRVYKIQSTFRELALRQGFYLREETSEGRAKFAKGIGESETKIRTTLDLAIEKASEKGKPQYLEVDKLYKLWLGKAVLARKAAEQNDPKLANEINLECREFRTAADEHLQDLIELNEASLDKEGKDAEALFSHSSQITLLVSICTILFSSILAYVILRATSIAIKEVVDTLSEGAEQVSAAATQISSSSTELSQAATEQAASLGETAASVEEMNSMIDKSSESAKTVADVASQSRATAVTGQESVSKMIQSMSEINSSNTDIMTQVTESNNKIAEIVQIITEIGNKTKVINDIVFQTKLLSFNASVEAARAGEHGKGFAVVAEEVGNLAQMSGNAAKEISGMLEASTQKVESIITDTKSQVERLIKNGKEKVEYGTNVAKECGEVLGDIVQKVTSASEMAREISTATSEQAKGIQEITKAMGQLDQVTQQNSAASVETASASEELSAQAESLRHAVVTLVATINGANAKQTPPPTHLKTAKSNVIRMKPKKSVATGSNHEFKKTAGGDVPSYDDGGFKEV